MKKSIIIIVVAILSLQTGCKNKRDKVPNMETLANKETNLIFPKGNEVNNDNFSGTAWHERLVTNSDVFDVTIGNVTFEPGVRNSWHSHPGGQILLVTAGKGWYQERGKEAQLLQKGDVIEIPPDVEHWHGATHDSAFEHIAIGTKTHLGAAVWLEPVTEEEYNRLINK